jgi:hypothetical protein
MLTGWTFAPAVLCFCVPPFAVVTTTLALPYFRDVLVDSKLLGTARIRQVRMDNESCADLIPDAFKVCEAHLIEQPHLKASRIDTWNFGV